MTSGDPHLDLPAQSPRSRFNPIQPGGVAQVEQPVHLGHVPAQAPRQTLGRGLQALAVVSAHLYGISCFHPRSLRRQSTVLSSSGKDSFAMFQTVEELTAAYP